MDFEKLSDRLKGFVQSAQTLAVREGHPQITPEHLLKVLLDDPEDLIHKAVGWMLRSADGQRTALNAFLDKHAGRMPRVMLRNALEHYPPEERARYLAMAKAK